MRRLAVSLGCVVALCSWASAARASVPRGARLVWARGMGAEVCVGARGLEEDVKARLGFDPFARRAEIEVEGTVSRTPSGFRAELSFRDEAGKPLGVRRFESPDPTCRSVGEAVAVAVTVAIDPDAPGSRLPLEEEMPVEPAPPPVVVVVEERGPRARVSLAVGLGGGLLPGVSAVTTLRTSVFLGEQLELGLGYAYWPEVREGGLGFGLAAAEVRACAIPARVLGPLRLCVGGLAGFFDAVVHAPELTPVEVGSSPWAAVELGPVASVRLFGPLSLEAGASLIVPVIRRQALLRNQSEPVWEQGVLGGRGELGLGAVF